MLQTFEEQFQGAIFGSDNIEFLDSSGRVSPSTGVSIYHNNVFSSLTKILAEIFPVCQRLVGDDFFSAMVEIFIQNNPSREPSLINFGEHFPKFVAQFEPASSLPYLSDVCLFEWGWHQTYYAADDPILDTDALAMVPADKQGDICFCLPSGCILLSSDYPIHKIWEVNQAEYTGEPTVNLAQGGALLLIWRCGFEQRADGLSKAEWQLLQVLKSGHRMADVTTKTTVDVTEVLPELVRHGWIVDFELKD